MSSEPESSDLYSCGSLNFRIDPLALSNLLGGAKMSELLGISDSEPEDLYSSMFDPY